METPLVMNVYCDESCHLEHDGKRAMVLGAVWCEKSAVGRLHSRIAQLKSEFGLSRFFEVKWGKVSPSKVGFYEALVTFFFETAGLHFRAWVIPDKMILRHEEYEQTHDDWYYKMYFNMLKTIIAPDRIYHIYLDVKDTRSRQKLKKLHEVLANANYDFERNIVDRMQHIHSHDVGLLQLADLLIGAISYVARGLTGSPAKQNVVNLIRKFSGLSLTRNTLLRVKKVNICYWRPSSRAIDER